MSLKPNFMDELDRPIISSSDLSLQSYNTTGGYTGQHLFSCYPQGEGICSISTSALSAASFSAASSVRPSSFNDQNHLSKRLSSNAVFALLLILYTRIPAGCSQQLCCIINCYISTSYKINLITNYLIYK